MTTIWTFNPGFYTDEQLVDRFCVREAALEALVSGSRANGGTNQHTLVVGQRGFGKTMLLRRFAAQARRDPGLARRWYPVVFAEESYPVSSAGELWLEALTHLADATKDPRWQRAYLELRRERDEARLRSRALAQLLDFADEQRRGVIIVMENVDRLLGELPEADGWAVRETLLHERRIQLVAAAPRRFEGVDDPKQPFYELFRRVQLDPLGDPEIATLWRATNGEELPAGRAVALRILTGGNPRLVVLLASVGLGMTLRTLVDELTGLIDQHTNYFSANIEAITSTDMRRVFLALAEHWAPATAREVAEATRMEVNQASTLLGRLVDQGRAEVVRAGKTKTYQVSERLYNIYYLMRRRGVHEARLTALVDFMALFLEPTQLPQMLVRFADEACDPAGEPALTTALVEHFVKRRGATFVPEFLAKAPRRWLAEQAPKRLRRKMKSPEALLVLLRRADGAEWVEEAVGVLRKLDSQATREAALALARAIVPRLSPGVSGQRDACACALWSGGLDEEALAVSPPRAEAPLELGAYWFMWAMQAGRKAEAIPFLAQFRACWADAESLVPVEERGLAWEWIVEMLAQSGQTNEAVEVAKEHPSRGVFARVVMVTSTAAASRVAHAWTDLRPEDPDAWGATWLASGFSDGHALERATALGWPLTWLGLPVLALRGDVVHALPLLAVAAIAKPIDNSDETILTPGLLALARRVPAATLVDALRGTPAATRLEPIYVALRRRAGEDVVAPREIVELADVVDQRIASLP